MELTAGTSSICIDTGASACISHDSKDFLGIREVQNISINGISIGLDVAGIGTLHWLIVDDTSTELDVHVHNSLYVPKCPMKLLFPQQLAMQCKCVTLEMVSIGLGSILLLGNNFAILLQLYCLQQNIYCNILQYIVFSRIKYCKY
jgi:hypothetical protein